MLIIEVKRVLSHIFIETFKNKYSQFFFFNYFQENNNNYTNKMVDTQHFCLRWNNYQSSITSAFENLRDDEDFVDVTLACDGRSLKAHRVVLSACSPFFRELLKVSTHRMRTNCIHTKTCGFKCGTEHSHNRMQLCSLCKNRETQPLLPLSLDSFSCSSSHPLRNHQKTQRCNFCLIHIEENCNFQNIIAIFFDV